MRNRASGIGRATRTVQFLTDNDSRAANYLTASSQNQNNNFALGRKKNMFDSKTIRMPKEKLMDILFEGFEKYPYWSFKGIVEYTKQPVV